MSLAVLHKCGAVIPAKAGIQVEKTGFRIKSGMTKSIKLMSEFVDTLYALDDRRMGIVKCGIERVGMEV